MNRFNFWIGRQSMALLPFIYKGKAFPCNGVQIPPSPRLAPVLDRGLLRSRVASVVRTLGALRVLPVAG